ncbi:MAG TPA: hypothetical protein VMM14_08990 [Acidimicrobiia bacterium]|nr:hypothetical protein [Acidimicrobiia bacterium]
MLGGCVAGADAPSPTDPHGFTTTTTIPTTTTTLSLEASLGAFRDCMAERDVPVGEIPLDGLGRPRMADVLSGLDLGSRTVLEALEDCGVFLSVGALALAPDPELRELVQAQLEAFSMCVRAEGVSDFPDPVGGFDGVGSPYPTNRIPWTDPLLAGAVATCRNADSDT